MEIKKYDSVGGWLLLFCFSLLIGTPLKTISNIGNSYNVCNSLFNDFPGLKYIFYIDSILSLILIFLSFKTGLALWLVKKNAVNKAKNYLLINLCYCIISTFLPFFAGLPKEANDSMGEEIFKNLFYGLFYVIIWYWYLNVSKRVKATFHFDNNQSDLNLISYINKEDVHKTRFGINENYTNRNSEDIISESYGDFGLDKTNPIPINGIDNICTYMSQLHYEAISKDGSNILLPIQYQRTIENDDSEIGSEMSSAKGLVGSTFSINIRNEIDVYNIYTFDGSKKLAKLFVFCYHSYTSKLAPNGFIIKK